MLYSVDNQVTPITTIPYIERYNRWIEDLAPADHEAIIEELNRRIDGTEIQTSSWIPGKWEGTVFMAIYVACQISLII